MLRAEITDFGHCAAYTPLRAQTAFPDVSGCWPRKAQFRRFSKPLDRQASQFHAAGDEN